MEIRGLQAEELSGCSEIWPFLRNFAERSSGRVTAEELYRDLCERDRQAWIAGDWQAVVLTSVHPTWVCIDHCAGEGREGWQDAVDAEITAWATHLGKARVFVNARPGWAGLARKNGWHELHREYVKELF